MSAGGVETTLPPQEFAAFHAPALERDQVRHNVLMAGLGRGAGLERIGFKPHCRAWHYPRIRVNLSRTPQG